MDHERRIFLEGRPTAFPVSDAEVLERFPEHRRLLCKLFTLPDAVPDHSQVTLPAPYIRKPAFNPDGLGVAEVFRDGKLIDDVKPGHVLQPLHEGHHLSIDIIIDDGKPIDAIAMHAVYAGDPTDCRPAWWDSAWRLGAPSGMARSQWPDHLWSLMAGYRGVLNVEMIVPAAGPVGHLIDVHPRASAQFLPIWGEDWIWALDRFYRGNAWRYPQVGRGRSYACWGETAVTMARDGSAGRAAVVNVLEGAGLATASETRIATAPGPRRPHSVDPAVCLHSTFTRYGMADICDGCGWSRMRIERADEERREEARAAEAAAASTVAVDDDRTPPWSDYDTAGIRRVAKRALEDNASTTSAAMVNAANAAPHLAKWVLSLTDGPLPALRDVMLSDNVMTVEGVPAGFIRDLAKHCRKVGLDPATLRLGCGVPLRSPAMAMKAHFIVVAADEPPDHQAAACDKLA